MDLKPIKPKRIYKIIVDQIKDGIIAGKLHPGDKLLSERELAEQLNVSRASVREALCALDMAGLIEIKPGEGTFIRQFDVNSIIEPLSLMLLLERDKIKEILEVRKALEVESVGLACENATDKDLQKIKEALEDMKRDLVNGNSGEEADIKFHYAIAEASGNSLLMKLMNTITDTMNQTISTTRQLWLSYDKGSPKRLFEEHKSIYEAIHERDKEKARSLMDQHLWKVEQELLKWSEYSEQ
ncbi:MAG: FadR [Clostridiales bacterium]|jgi:GntR family transcriptional repressor for pyruvate dehydrogenase complex|nr:FadR [Clostridiales bacterium]